MLHRRRRRLEQLAAAEAVGESFWTYVLDDAVRAKIQHALVDATARIPVAVAERARTLILRDEGLLYLTRAGLLAHNDFFSYLMSCADDMVATVIEAIVVATGDAHVASAASIADAWFIVHVVGALILRLAAGEKRSAS